MEFNLYGDFDKGSSIVDMALHNRGIGDLSEYKNALYEDHIKTTNPNDMVNGSKAALALRDAIRTNKKIGILVDGDCDGFCSAAMMWKFLNVQYDWKMVQIIMLPYKSHGLKNAMEDIYKSGCEFLIVPDAGTNDYVEQKELTEAGIQVLIIDHHDIDNIEAYQDSPALIFNNQDDINLDNKIVHQGQFVNREFTGAGMVFEFLKLFDQWVSESKIILNDYLPLLALGQVGDSSDVSNMEIRQLMLAGFKDMDRHPLFKLYFGGTDFDDMSAHAMSFSIIPQINAVARIGEFEDRMNLLKCLAEFWQEDTVTHVKRRCKNPKTGKMEMRTLSWTEYEVEADSLKKIKAKQDNLVKSVMGKLTVKHDELPSIDVLPSVTIVLLDKKTIKHQALTGLIAGKLISKYEQPALVVVEKSDIYAGSGRGFDNVTLDFKTACQETGEFTVASGHPQAFGVEFDADKLDVIKDKLSKSLNNSNGAHEHNVDGVYSNGDLSPQDLAEITDNMSLFGGKAFEPELGFKSIPVEKKSISIRGSVVTMKAGNLTFVMFNAQKLGDMIKNSGFKSVFYFDLYGQVSHSSWANEDQIILQDYEEVEAIGTDQGLHYGDLVIDPVNSSDFTASGDLIF